MQAEPQERDCLKALTRSSEHGPLSPLLLTSKAKLPNPVSALQQTRGARSWHPDPVYALVGVFLLRLL